MQNNRMMWVIVLSAVLFFGVAVVTLRAAERAIHPGAVAPERQHPSASALEESATIADDPTTAPDPSQSADNNVSFPTNI